MTLTHLTLNTGHTHHSRREDMAPAVEAALLPVIDAEGGPIPRMDGWFVDFMFPVKESPVTGGRVRRDGGAWFQIADQPGLSLTPVITGVVAWSPAMSKGAWRQLVDGYTMLRPTLEPIDFWRDPPLAPPPAPWLAVYLSPLIVLLADPATIGVFGDLERCIAWSLIP